MVNSIIDGIVLKLDSIFGNDSVIHTESIEQGLEEPCFYVALLASRQKLFFNNRYYLEHSFDVHYFPGTADKNAEMHDVATKLSGLEYITSDGNLLRGTDLNCEIVDGVLHFFVQYNYYAYLTKEEVEKMQAVRINSGIGG